MVHGRGCEEPLVGSALDARSYPGLSSLSGRLTDESGVQLEREPAMKLVVTSVALAMLTLSGCSSGNAAAGPSSSPVTATPSATPPTPTDLAKVQALAIVPVYLETIDELYNDPKVPLNNLYNVSAQPDALVELKAIGLSRSYGNRQSGRVKLVRARVTGVNLTNMPKAKPHPVFPTVSVVACIDVSGVRGVGPTGRSLVPANRPRYQIEQLTVLNLSYPRAAGWRVSNSPNKQANSCDG